MLHAYNWDSNVYAHHAENYNSAIITYDTRRPIPPMSSCKLIEPLPSVSNKLKKFLAKSCKCHKEILTCLSAGNG